MMKLPMKNIKKPSDLRPKERILEKEVPQKLENQQLILKKSQNAIKSFSGKLGI
jgi:hypothetical protein